MATFKTLLEMCERKQALFVDHEFPPTDRSIGRRIAECTWLRASQFALSSPPTSSPATGVPSDDDGDDGAVRLFVDGVSPDDIQQGSLGDCFFLSALSVLAETPSRIEALFAHHVDNPWGLYCVSLHVGGRAQQDVVLDDFFPCNVQTSQPLFSRNHGPELWVLLLEKAYAKMHGSYMAIETGSPATALSDLTGCPCFLYKLPEMRLDDVWETIARHDRLDHCMCASVPDSPRRDLLKEVGLVEQHAYSLIGAKKFGSTRLVQIRNPWGAVEWKGAWSDTDSRHWTAEAKRVMHWTPDANDGTFWMQLEDFVRYFDAVTALVFEDGWSFASSPVTLKAQVSLLSLNVVDEVADVYITVHQPQQSLGIRMCVVSRDLPCVPFGGTKEAYAQSAIVSSQRMRVPPGTFWILVEVFPQHVQRLPFNVVVSAFSSSAKTRIVCESTQQSPQLSFVLPQFAQTLGVCDLCGYPLAPGAKATKDKKFHSCCFICWFCGTQLVNSHAVKDGNVACVDCASGKRSVATPVGLSRMEKYSRERQDRERLLRPSKPAPVQQPSATPPKPQYAPPQMPPPLQQLATTTTATAPATATATATTTEHKHKHHHHKHGGQHKKSHKTDTELRAKFSSFDVDRSGTISSTELTGLLAALDYTLSDIGYIREVQLREVMDSIDRDHSGSVDFKELKHWWRSEHRKKLAFRIEHLNTAAVIFKRFADASGSIKGAAMQQLHQALLQQGRLVAMPYAQFVRELDTDKSSSIEFTEFLAWLDRSESAVCGQY